MTERPILFSGAMVRALLAGTKTQTRRLMKPQPSEGWRPHSWGDIHRMRDGEFIFKRNGDLVVTGYGPSNEDGSEAHACRYGMPGDRLWVREALRQGSTGNQVEYALDRRLVRDAQGAPMPWLWKRSTVPPMHCTRTASRLTLEITDVRLQRLHDISEEDARAEGIDTSRINMEVAKTFPSPMAYEFRRLWESINGAGSWDANPRVWALTFKRVAK